MLCLSYTLRHHPGTDERKKLLVHELEAAVGAAVEERETEYCARMYVLGGMLEKDDGIVERFGKEEVSVRELVWG